jgi:hypothetical protein
MVLPESVPVAEARFGLTSPGTASKGSTSTIHPPLEIPLT